MFPPAGMHCFIHTRLQQCKQLMGHLHLGSVRQSQQLRQCLGVFQVLGEVALHATDRRQLLTSVWKAFAQLWEEALQVLVVDHGIGKHLASANIRRQKLLVLMFKHSPSLMMLAVHAAPALCESCFGCWRDAIAGHPCTVHHQQSWWHSSTY